MLEHQRHGLYRPEFEKDSCGFGLIVHMDDQPSHKLVQTAITALARMTHRGAVAADGTTRGGCGLLMKKDRKSVEWGKSGAVRVDPGGPRNIKKKKYIAKRDTRYKD